MPSDQQLAKLYPADYHSFAESGWLSHLRCSMRVRRLTRLLQGREGPVLDFGCGSGAFLKMVADRWRGRQLIGYEISDERQITRTTGGALTLVRGGLNEIIHELPSCAIITMNHVIEHLGRPLEVLVRLREKLVPGALIEGQTPAADSLERWVFGSKWSGFHAPRHTVVLSRTGLRCLLVRAGFESPRVSAAFNPAAGAVSLSSVHHGKSGGIVRRNGLRWLCYLGLSTLAAPVDLLSRAGVVNFSARCPAE